MGPNELSFNLIEAWSNIYGVKAALPKSNSSINGKTASGGVPGMFLAFSSEDHARMRKNLNPAFSEKALREQEQRIMEYVNLLIRRLAEHSERGPVNIGEWYNYTTFDIIGELLYGDSFDCLENSMLNDW
jgi:cytochrome P450